MSKKLSKVKCGNDNCGKTIAIIVEEQVVIQCEHCGTKSVVPKQVSYEPVENVVYAKII